MIAIVTPINFPKRAFIDKNLLKCTPAKTAFISGRDEPSASLLRYSLNVFKDEIDYPTHAVSITQLTLNTIHMRYLSQ